MKTVFFDVDTQLDFVYPSGALYVPGSEALLPAIVNLNRHAAEHGFPVISTVDAHAENDAEFRTWPAHCVAGALGQNKPAATLLPHRVIVPNAPGEYSIGPAQQVLIEKQALDCFTNRNLAEILKFLNAERFIVYGVVTEFCVRCAALGLLASGPRVELVADAIQTLDRQAAERTLAEFTAAGGTLTTVSQVLTGQ